MPHENQSALPLGHSSKPPKARSPSGSRSPVLDHLARQMKFHGHRTNYRQSPTYVSWMCMRRRCQDPKFKDFQNYGGRGIKVCRRWAQFTNFLKDMGERPKGYLIDRINRFGNYEPKNCKWSTFQESAVNRSSTVFVWYQGELLTASAAAKVLGVSFSGVCQFVRRNRELAAFRDIEIIRRGNRRYFVFAQ